MLLNLAELLWSEEGLNGPVLVDWGNVTGVRPDLVAAAGNRIYIFSPGDNRYFLSASSETAAEVLSLAVGLPFPDAANIVLGLEDRLAVYGVRQGALVRFWESEPDPGARFVDLILGDLDGDGRPGMDQGRSAIGGHSRRSLPDVGPRLVAAGRLPGERHRSRRRRWPGYGRGPGHDGPDRRAPSGEPADGAALANTFFKRNATSLHN